MIQKIVDVKNPSLREISKEVAIIDKKTLQIIGDMKETLDAQNDPEGVGLAAPQIGKNVRIFLIKNKGKTQIVINPEILSKAVPPPGAKKASPGKPLEGCLSLPHYYGPLNRTSKIKIKYMDETGAILVKEFRGFEAQIVDHEIDHLNGILFVDHIVSQKVPLYKFNKEGDWEEVNLV